MKKEYDFSKGKPNPYAKKAKKQLVINLSEEALDYFTKMSEELKMPIEDLINLFLLDIVRNNRKLSLKTNS